MSPPPPPAGYAPLLSALKAVNTELVGLYWDIGCENWAGAKTGWRPRPLPHCWRK
jgi:hypothetical protein